MVAAVAAGQQGGNGGQRGLGGELRFGMVVAVWWRRPASLATRRQCSVIGSGDAATAAVIARWRRGSRRGAAGSAAAVATGSESVAQHWKTSTATTVLPPPAATVAMKTLAATAMAGAQTINNQLKAQTRQR